MSNATELLPGFDEPVLQSQMAFKSLLEALARPGRLFTLPAPESAVPGLSAGSAAIALTLVDYETPVWLDGPCQLAAEYLQFHCGCRIVSDPMQASFAFATDFSSLPPLEHFKLGTDEEPEDSTTLIVGVSELTVGKNLVLTGPGIETEHHLIATGFNDSRVSQRTAIAALFPRGLDLFLTCEQQVAGIARTTQIKTVRS